MARFQLRTQLLIAAIVIICAFTGAILVIVRYMVRSEIRQQAGQSVEASVRAFKNVQIQRDAELSRTASLLAELPPLMAVMTTQHAPTIQDASEPFWKLADSVLFLLPDPNGRVLGFQIAKSGGTAEIAQRNLKPLLSHGSETAWWLDDGELYGVESRPITIGPETGRREMAFSWSVTKW